jgi:hypothetical protein
MARYKRTLIIDNANEWMERTGNLYFLGVDIMAYIRDKTGETRNMTEVVQVLLHRKIAQKTGIVMRRGGGEYHLLKKYGVPNPPEDWDYSQIKKVEA